MESETPVRSRLSLIIGIILVVVVVSVAIVLYSRAQAPSAPAQPWSASALSDAVVTGTPDLIPPTAPVEGPFSAKTTIVEFLDYQCPGCGQYYPIMKDIRQTYAGKIRFVVRQFPWVEIHAFAKGAAIASVCAQRQGKFFEYSDVLFQNQNYLRRQDLEQYAGELKLDTDAFHTCLDDPTAEAAVIRDRKAGEALGVQATPTVFVNGKMLKDLPSEDDLKKLIDRGL